MNNNTGAFGGLLADDGKTPLPPEKTFVYTHDIQNNDFYGRSRFLNFVNDWDASEKLRDKQGRHAERIASAIPIISYPEGESKNSSAFRCTRPFSLTA